MFFFRYGAPKHLHWLPRLQNVQNVAARIIVRLGKNAHITLVLKELHWLLVDLRIVYNINLLTFNNTPYSQMVDTREKTGA